MAWQPIETAPKSGVWILAAWCRSEDDFGYPTATVRYTGNGEWAEKIGLNSEESVGTPSHWMPLPAPPQDA